MNIKNGINAAGRAARKAAGGAVDAIGTGVGAVEGFTGRIGDKAAGKIINKSGDVLFDESVQGVRRKIAQGINDNGARIGKAIGGGTEGAIVGLAGGAVVGGISGGIDDDETFVGGALKGGLVGAAGGFAIGATSAFAHNSAGLLDNALYDASAVSERISKWKTGMGNGISEATTSWNNSIYNPKVMGVL